MEELGKIGIIGRTQAATQGAEKSQKASPTERLVYELATSAIHGTPTTTRSTLSGERVNLEKPEKLPTDPWLGLANLVCREKNDWI